MKFFCSRLISIALLTTATLYADSLIADWDFSSGCRDRSLNGLNGGMEGYQTAVDPETGQSCALNDGSSGKGAWMTVPDRPVFQNINALTIIARVKALPTNRSGWLLYKTAPTGCDWGLCINTEAVKKKENLYRVGLKIDTVMKWFWIDREKHSPFDWNCFAVTVDLGGDRIPRLTINGQLIAESDSFGLDDFYTDGSGVWIGTVDAYEFNKSTLPYSGNPLFIGGANAIMKNSFQGMIETIQLFNTALNEQALQSISSQPKGCFK